MGIIQGREAFCGLNGGSRGREDSGDSSDKRQRVLDGREVGKGV